MKKKLYYLSLMLLPLYLISAIPYFKSILEYYYYRFLMSMQMIYSLNIIIGVIGAVFIFIIIKYYNKFKTNKMNKIILLSCIILLVVLWVLNIFRVVPYFFNPNTLFFIIALYLFMLFDKGQKKDNIEL